MTFLLFNLLLILIIFFLLIILSWVWPPDSPWAPWWKTDIKTARAMCNLAKVGKNDVVYELGSGNATALIIAVKEYGARGVGIEIDPLRFLVSTLMIRINRVVDKLLIKRKNFFEEDISKASAVYVYLVPKTLARLKSKFLKELKPGTRIVSLVYEMDLPLIKKDEKNRLFLYTIPATKYSLKI